MSTLKVTNIQATGETVDRAVSGVAGMWINFGQETTQSINDSINVASITDEGTGKTTVKYTNDFDNNDYATASHCQDGGGENDIRTVHTSNETGRYAAGSHRVITGQPDSTPSAMVLNDAYALSLVSHGDLA